MSTCVKYAKRLCKDTKVKQDETVPESDKDNEKQSAKYNGNEPSKLTNTSTPVRKGTIPKDTAEDENLSPIFLRFTQDNPDDDTDVIWDWDSPHKRRSKNIVKKRILRSSPNLPKKQIIFEKQKPQFNSLKAQLESLVNQLSAVVDDSSNDCEILEDDDIFVKPNVPVSAELDSIPDAFGDDSFDDEMIKCSQRVEQTYNVNTWCTSIVNINNNNNNSNKHMNNTIEDDSFDMFLEDINEEQLLSQASTSSGNSSENYIHHQSISKNMASPRALSRTNSVPVSFLTSRQKSETRVTVSSFSRTKSEEFSPANEAVNIPQAQIERKRLEAKALLEKKRKQNEIERRRKEALERLNKNRIQKMQRNLIKAQVR